LRIRVKASCILAKNLPTFCPCPETLCEAKCKSDGLANLLEGISMQHINQAVA
jgi:hypothetical protein